MKITFAGKTIAVAAIALFVLIGAGLGGYFAFGRSGSPKKPALLGTIAQESSADRADAAKAQANVRASVSAVEAYWTEHDTYVGISIESLRKIESRIGINAMPLDPIDPAFLGKETYCIQSTVGGHVYSKKGPAAAILEGACA